MRTQRAMAVCVCSFGVVWLQGENNKTVKLKERHKELLFSASTDEIISTHKMLPLAESHAFRHASENAGLVRLKADTTRMLGSFKRPCE